MEPTKKEQPSTDKETRGLAENERANYTSLPSDGPVSQSETSANADLAQTDKKKETEQHADDLAANAQGNKATDESE